MIDPSVLERLRHYDTPTLSNAIEGFDLRPRDEGFASGVIRCMFPDLAPVVGFAATATIRARGTGHGYQGAMYRHVLEQPRPRIAVIQDLDDPSGVGALWGEVNANIFGSIGCIGCVTDGSVRDLKEAHASGFQFFAGSVGVSHAYARIEEVGVAVTVGGLQVRPGDLLHADQHGVLLIPSEIAADLPDAAEALIRTEKDLIAWLRSPEFSAEELIKKHSERRTSH